MGRLGHDINKRASVEEQKLWTLDTPSDRQNRGQFGHCREARAYTEVLVCFVFFFFKLYFYLAAGLGGEGLYFI